MPLYPSFYPPAHQAVRAMRHLPHRVFQLRLRKVPEARREIQAARKVTIKNSTLSAKGLRDAVAKAYGDNYLPDQAMDAEMIESEFGLTKDMYDEIVAEAPIISFHPDRLVAVKAKKGKESEVKRALEDALLVMKEQQMQYPVNVAKVNAGKVLEKDGYYCFMILGETDDTSENDNDAAKFAEKQIDIGVKAFDNYFA